MKTEGDDLGLQKILNDRLAVIFHQGPDHAKTGESQILERPRFGRRIQAGI